MGEIAKRLNSDHVPTRRDRTWNSNRVGMLLRNPACVKADADVYHYYSSKGCVITNNIDDFIGENGLMFYGKRNANTRKYTAMEEQKISVGLHKGEISSELFLRCQRRLDSNMQIKRSGKGSYSWLSGIIQCGKCGYSLTAIKTPKNGTDYYYFRCSGRLQNICRGRNATHHVKEIEDAVQKELFRVIKVNENLTYEDTAEDYSADNDLKIQRSKIDQQIQNLLRQIADGNGVVNEYIMNLIHEMDSQKKFLTNKMSEKGMRRSQGKEIKKLMDMVKDWEKCSLEEKKVLIGFFVERVVVYDDKIQIYWKHQFNQKIARKSIKQ